MSLTFVTLILDIQDGSGVPFSGGYAYLAPTQQLTDTADHILVARKPVSVPFAAPAPQVSLVGTDSSDVTQADWAWTISFSGMESPPEPFSFMLPAAGGATQYLSDVAIAEPSAAMAAYLPLPAGTPTAGQVPVATGAGQASAWGNGGGGATFEHAFTSAASVTVTHNLGKHPSVTVTDTAEDTCFGDVVYLSTSALTVTFSAPFSGTVICN